VRARSDERRDSCAEESELLRPQGHKGLQGWNFRIHSFLKSLVKQKELFRGDHRPGDERPCPARQPTIADLSHASGFARLQAESPCSCPCAMLPAFSMEDSGKRPRKGHQRAQPKEDPEIGGENQRNVDAQHHIKRHARFCVHCCSPFLALFIRMVFRLWVLQRRCHRTPESDARSVSRAMPSKPPYFTLFFPHSLPPSFRLFTPSSNFFQRQRGKNLSRLKEKASPPPPGSVASGILPKPPATQRLLSNLRVFRLHKVALLPREEQQDPRARKTPDSNGTKPEVAAERSEEGEKSWKYSKPSGAGRA